jgi:hypothetical protein
MAKSNNNKKKTSGAKGDETKVSANIPDGSNDEKESVDETPEVWDIVEVLMEKGNSKVHSTCLMDGCSGRSVAVWATNLEPDDKWPMCEDCQLSEFGGWPAGIERAKNPEEGTQDVQEKQHESDQANAKIDGHNKGHPTPITPVNSAETNDTGIKSTPDAIDGSEDNASEAGEPEAKEAQQGKEGKEEDLQEEQPEGELEQQQEEGDQEEVWYLKGIFSIEAVTGAPIKCSDETCLLPAACSYVSNLAPTTKWYTCLDCQVSQSTRSILVVRFRLSNPRSHNSSLSITGNFYHRRKTTADGPTLPRCLSPL